MNAMSKPRTLLVALLLAALAAAVMLHLRSADVVATLASATPGVSRDFRDREKQWVGAALGDTMRIGDALRQSQTRLEALGFSTRLHATADALETKLLVRRGKIEIKVEVNFVMRGIVHPTRMAALLPRARDVLLADLEIPVASLEDVYGGKLVAAMDRQHPRDLYDVLQLFDHEGITPAIRRAFVIYLASHNRPVHEVLFAAPRDIAHEFERGFKGMTTEPVQLDLPLAARERMMRELQRGLDATERKFLISLGNEPDWSLLAIPHARLWKLHNLRQLQNANPDKFAAQADMLAELLA